jgi:hypothetical protein
VCAQAIALGLLALRTAQMPPAPLLVGDPQQGVAVLQAVANLQ